MESIQFLRRIFKRAAGLALLFGPLSFVFGDDRAMNPEKLLSVIEAYSENVEAHQNVIIFEYNSVPLVCIFDAAADRMRIISEIMDADKLPVEQLYIVMGANYHTALDARYAIGEGKLFSTYIHPLSPLTAEQLESAIRQVSNLSLTFGSEYSSGELLFPGSSESDVEEEVDA